MSKTIEVLIIDDDLSIINFYKKSFEELTASLWHSFFRIHTAKSCDAAIKKMEVENITTYDLIIVDVKLTAQRRGKTLSFEEKGKLMRRFFKKSKIAVSIPLTGNFIINKIFGSVKPDAIIIKEDLTFRHFTEFIESALEGVPYYSKTVLNFIRIRLSNNFYLDDIDKKFLHELSNGTKMKDLPKITGLSLGGVERRKRRLKKIFEVELRNDKTLIRSAKKYGFV